MSGPDRPTAKPKEEPAAETKLTEPTPNAAVEPAVAPAPRSDSSPPWRQRLRRPTVVEAGAFVALVGGIVGLVFKFAPGCQPQPPSPVVKASISDVETLHPVSFRRFLQRQQLPIPPDMSRQFLARRGVMVEFAYEIVGLSGKHLRLAWELSDQTTNDLVAGEQSAYELVPSKNDDAGDWAVWIPAPKPGRRYYATVTIYKPPGPPYELKHFRTPAFRGFAST
jgi:hypothetical protein